MAETPFLGGHLHVSPFSCRIGGSLVACAVLIPVPPRSRQEEFAQPSFGIAACLTALRCEEPQTFKTKLTKTLC